ncbi:MAG: adenylosuccinate lyase, partial [bacterium]
MIPRYSRPEMAALWAPEKKFQVWLEIELLACEAMADLDIVPKEAARRLREKASFSLERIEAIESEVHHDVIAFLTAVGETVGEDARWLHLGLTSSDVLDTSLAVLLKEAGQLLLNGLDDFLSVLRRRAEEFQEVPMVGRTHGVHAEATTFGLKLALWWDEMRRRRDRLESAAQGVAVGKLSGAVGTFAHAPPEVEAYVCERLGIAPAPASSQIVQRDRHADFLAALALLATSIEKIALEVRHLQRTEVREVEEYFAPGQKGSSAMPHKRNPIIAERLCGLARVVRGNLHTALENVPLWHERDISHSSAERIILPDSTILADYMVAKATELIDRLVVYPERMRENLGQTGGLLASQSLLVALAQAGLDRHEAYRLVQEHALRAWGGEVNFREAVMADPAITKHLSREALE